MAKASAKMSQKKKKSIKLPFGTLYVTTTSNNTIITLTDLQGNKISGGGTWMAWFKWAKESTPYAAEMLATNIVKEAKDQFGMKQVRLIMRWVGLWRDGVFKWINNVWGIDIVSIREDTWIQFGGCQWIRPKRN